MSDGMSDANAMNKLVLGLREAVYELLDAMKAAERGHRGWAIDSFREVNSVLRGSGYELYKISSGGEAAKPGGRV